MARPDAIRVFLIEDSFLIQQSITDSVTASGHIKIANIADTADSALNILQKEQFDVLIIDLQLRKGTGIEVLAEIKKTPPTKETLIIVLTNHATPAYRSLCQQYGVKYFFDKSLEFSKMFDILNDHANARVNRQFLI